MSNRIIIDPDICNGKPVVRGTRITVQTILEFLAAGDSVEDVLVEYPKLSRPDIEACLDYAAKITGNRVSVGKSFVTGVLLDENLPAHLALPAALPIEHVSVLGDSPPDSEIWDHARANDLVIVSKDADFFFRMAAATPPPRVVHLRIGNMRTRELKSTIEHLWPQIEGALGSGKLINVYADRIEVVA